MSPSPPVAEAGLTPAQELRALRVLQAATVTSSFDRFAVGTLLVTLAADLDVPLGSAASVASAYFLCYGLSQPLWGLASDRYGRVRTMRWALALAAVGALVSASTSSLALLVLARAGTGACMAAVVPTGLVWVGDAVPLARRQRTLTDISAATAVGVAVATGLGGLLAAHASWRVAFLLPGVAAGVLATVLGRGLPEPPRPALAQGGLGTALRQRWGVCVLLLALVEGAALLGLLTWFAPALESEGWTPTAAGGVVALYGVGLLLSSRVVKRLAGRTRPEVFLGSGAAGLAVAYLAVATSRSGWVVGAAALLVGSAWAGMHSTMQTWATEVVPQARAAMVSLFVALLFVGSGLTTAGLTPLADSGHWRALFVVGAVVAVVFGVVAVLARTRYEAPRQPGGPPAGPPAAVSLPGAGLL